MTSKKKISTMCEIVDADYLGGHKLRLKFNDGLVGIVDLEDYVQQGVFRVLRDPKKFTHYGLIYGTVVWKPYPDGMELDIAPEYLYQRIFDAKRGKKKHGFDYFNADSWASHA